MYGNGPSLRTVVGGWGADVVDWVVGEVWWGEDEEMNQPG